MTLEAFFQLAKAELLRANQDRRHPFRTVVLNTHDEYPATRTVVKRKTFEDLSTLIYTDIRSIKVDQLQENEKCSLLFYHPKKKLQIVIQAHAEIIQTGELFDAQKSIALIHPKDYSTKLAPGTPIDSSAYELVPEDQFILLKLHAQSIHLLQLGVEHHYRAVFSKSNNWKGQWLVP